MAKNKQPGRPTLPMVLMEGLRTAHALEESKKPAEALQILAELDRAYPHKREVLRNLANVCYDLKDLPQYEHAIRRLQRLEPRDADVAYSLAGAYLLNGRSALAIQAFQAALQRWPGHAKAAQARQEIPGLEEALRKQAAALSLNAAVAFDLLVQHDELLYYLAFIYIRGAGLLYKILIYQSCPATLYSITEV